MNFKIIKELLGGRYYVKVELSQLSKEDEAKSQKFGYPNLNIRLANGRDLPMKIILLNGLEAYGFYNQVEADEYTVKLKSQIIEIKNSWKNLTDDWTNEEIL